MPKLIRPSRVNHINAVVEDYDASTAHLRERYGAEFLMDLPQREWHACLMEIGRVIIELFVPHAFLLNSRYGPHYLGIEYQADVDEVREILSARGIRVVRDIGPALHTHPADCFGVSFEFFSGSFHEREWPNLGGKMKSAEYWHDEHALGLTGLKAYTVAVSELEAARAFFQSLFAAEVMYEAARPAVAARAIGLQIADAIVEIIAPVAEGALQRHLRECGQGIRSIIFGCRDINRVNTYFAERGIHLEPGSSSGIYAVPASTNLGLLFEFSE